MRNQTRGRASAATAARPPGPLGEVRAWLLKLYYHESDTWMPIPAWAHFYLEVGAALAVQQNASSSTVLAFSVPTRSYVAPLIASGYIACRAVVANDDFKEHLQLLTSLPQGAVLAFTEGDRKFKATLEGVTYENGRIKYIEVRTGRRETRFVHPDKAAQIEILNKDTVRLPEYPAGRAADAPSGLLGSLLPDSVAQTFMRVGRTECLLIGRRNQLEHELLSTELGVSETKGRVAQGHLQDLARADGISRNGSGYRSSVLPVSAKYYRGLERDFTCNLVVFDGANSYNRWRELWRGSHRVVVLDRTEHGFEEARLIANQEHSQRAEGNNVTLPITEVPSAVEVMAFRVAQ